MNLGEGSDRSRGDGGRVPDVCSSMAPLTERVYNADASTRCGSLLDGPLTVGSTHPTRLCRVSVSPGSARFTSPRRARRVLYPAAAPPSAPPFFPSSYQLSCLPIPCSHDGALSPADALHPGWRPAAQEPDGVVTHDPWPRRRHELPERDDGSLLCAAGVGGSAHHRGHLCLARGERLGGRPGDLLPGRHRGVEGGDGQGARRGGAHLLPAVALWACISQLLSPHGRARRGPVCDCHWRTDHPHPQWQGAPRGSQRSDRGRHQGDGR